MQVLKRTMILASLPALLMTGCASQMKSDTLQSDVDSLRTQVQAAQRESAEALRTANATQADVEAMRSTLEATRNDAAASRRMLDELNSRLDRTFGTDSYK